MKNEQPKIPVGNQVPSSCLLETSKTARLKG